MSPVIKTELAKGIEPREGNNYIVESCELEKTEVQGWGAYRVVMRSVDDNDDNEYNTMLWDRSRASIRSKLGAFMWAFEQYFDDKEKAQDTDNWIGAIIRVLSWKDKDREIRVVDIP